MSLLVDAIHAGYNGTAVLKGVNLQVEQGNICALMGRNGSGKTTVLRCINAILKPSEGKILVQDKPVASLTRAEIARLISVVPQSIHAVFAYSVLEMILMGSAVRVSAWAAPGPHEKQKALAVLDEVGIADLAHRPFHHLSGGEQQLVLLARALFQDAPMMLLDEPNSHLDFTNQHRMMEWMRTLVKKRGFTALISLHDPNLVLNYCDQAVMLKEGCVVAHGPIEEVMQTGTLQAVLGENIQMEWTVDGRRIVTPRRR